jgi:CRISPR/Cas system CMR-associated protein Cmr1 (group 7 of RAMP superfamily)
MQVYGSVSHHVMNIMGTAVMEAQYRKHLQDLLPRSEKKAQISQSFFINPRHTPKTKPNRCIYRMQIYNHVTFQGIFLNQRLDIGWISQMWLVLKSFFSFFGFHL